MEVMISAIQSKELSFGLTFTKEKLMRGNEARIGQLYKNVVAAKNIKVQQKNKSYLLTLLFTNLRMVHRMKANGIMREWCCNLKTMLMLSK